MNNSILNIQKLNNVIVIDNINLVDVVNGLIKDNVSIHICNGKIQKISPTVKNREKNIWNYKAFWAIPGLIDSHVHLFEIHKGNKIGEFERDFEQAKRQALANINVALKVGITCVRDVGAYSAFNNKLRNIIENDPNNLKFRIVSCGRHITKIGGHWSDRGVIWNPKEKSLQDIVVDELEGGADFIKVMNDDPIFDISELSEIAMICKNHGTFLSCHAFKKHTIDMALNAGAGTIEHAACYNENSCERAIINGVSLCPTLIAAHDSVEYANETLKSVCQDCTQDELVEWKAFLKANLPKTFQSGVKVLAGTDAGTFPTDFQSLPRELIQLCNNGATSLQALQSATINPAEAFNLSHIIGSIKVGKSADIVVLGKNPLENLEEAIVDVKLVISRGNIAFHNLGYFLI
jgi:imidazolonepropionase-like amidohydrolase